jgi:Fe2+ or Zn2+ uptake regulation protein
MNVYNKPVKVSELQLSVLNVVYRLGPCSSEAVKDNLEEKVNLLAVMRALHQLLEMGVINRVTVNHRSFYEAKSSLKSHPALFRRVRDQQ